MIILDVEASGLHQDSYPIQIAWVNTENGDEDSFYIKPDEEWHHWDLVAEGIHNITRKLLDDVGLPANIAAQRLVDRVGKDTTIYTDAPEFDGFWLGRLFDTVLIPDVSLKVDSVYSLCQYQEEVYQLNEIMSKQDRPHDALSDCYMIWAAVKQVIGC